MDFTAQVAGDAVARGRLGASPPMTRMELRRAARRSRSNALPWIVALVALVLRLLTAADGPTDWDSAQYAAAVGHFDVTHGQPQPPGYWLYVMSGRLIHQVSGLGTIHSLVLGAALASAAAAGLTTVAGRDLGGTWVGLAAGLVVASSPVRLVQRLHRRHLLVRHGGLLPAGHPGLAGPAGQLARRRRRGRPRATGRIPPVGAPVLRPPGADPGGGVDTAVEPPGRAPSSPVLLPSAVWLIPMSLSQPGGFGAWLRATRIEATGAARSTSVLDHAAAGANNLGTFAGFTVVALARWPWLPSWPGLSSAIRGPGGPAGDPPPEPRRRPTGGNRGGLVAALVPVADRRPRRRHRSPGAGGGPGPVRQGWVPPGLPARRGHRPPPAPGGAQPAGIGRVGVIDRVADRHLDRRRGHRRARRTAVPRGGRGAPARAG